MKCGGHPSPKWRALAPFGRLLDALSTKDQQAQRLQVKARWIAQCLCLLVPVSVLFLMLQLLLWPKGEAVGLALIGAEVACLSAFLIAVAGQLAQFAGRPRRWREWVIERVRAELLRRELALAWAWAGPYLNCTSMADLETVASDRIDRITGAPDEKSAFELIELTSDPSQPHWRDELEDALKCPARGGPSFPKEWGWEDAADTYLKDRIEDQMKYFEGKGKTLRRAVGTRVLWCVFLLVLSLIAAVAHLLMLWIVPRYVGEAADPALSHVHLAISILAVFLPPLAAAVTGTAETLEYGRRAKVCEAYSASLNKMHRRMRKLIDDDSKPMPKRVLAFKRLVLETEEMLSRELYLWVVLMSEGRLPVFV